MSFCKRKEIKFVKLTKFIEIIKETGYMLSRKKEYLKKLKNENIIYGILCTNSRYEEKGAILLFIFPKT